MITGTLLSTLRFARGATDGIGMQVCQGNDTDSFGATAGTVVMVFSPMLSPDMGTATASLVRRGLPVMVIDTLPPDAAPSPALASSEARFGRTRNVTSFPA